MNSQSTVKQYKNLANQIIFQAAYDYVNALIMRNTYEIIECEHFFRSEWFMLMTDIECETLIKRLKERSRTGNNVKRRWEM